ncbi:hypothetical protein HMPREF2600_10035 [Neisseria sp. HMSC077D05]|nr:hypothetical protein HMPREF2600_10035 [Neisseria sp. HMSC077D05]
MGGMVVRHIKVLLLAEVWQTYCPGGNLPASTGIFNIFLRVGACLRIACRTLRVWRKRPYPKVLFGFTGVYDAKHILVLAESETLVKRHMAKV